MKTRRSPKSPLQITILKQGTPSKKVVSVSFFVMNHSYKPIEFYINHLKRFLIQKKKLKEFEIRIYTDNSGKEIVLELVKEDPSVSVYHYDCKQFYDTPGHNGTFGTLMRFLPLFEPGLEVVWISDIDVPMYYLNPIRITELKKDKAQFLFRTAVCYNQNRTVHKKIYGRKYTILAGEMISTYTFPKYLFNTFLHNLQSGALKSTIQKLNNANPEKHSFKVPFGIDEYFLNTTFYNYIIKENLRCIIYKNYDYAGHLLRDVLSKEEKSIVESYRDNPTKLEFHRLKDIFQDHLEKGLKNYPCLQEMIDQLHTFKTSFLKRYVLNGKDM